MSKKGKARKNDNAVLPVMRPNAAGIDIGSTEIYAAVPADRDAENVRSFPTFTQDLYALADWLKGCAIETVAMESTGVYWIPLFQILEDRGFEVCLVNARHVKNVPGRRTDVSDCQWLQFLHSVGLLRSSYRPEQEVCAVRSLLRHRESLVQMAATHVHHMQKALDQMNLQLHHVISDITGLTGLAILEAILGGEHNPFVLAKLRNNRIKASEDVIAKSLSVIIGWSICSHSASPWPHIAAISSCSTTAIGRSVARSTCFSPRRRPQVPAPTNVRLKADGKPFRLTRVCGLN
jgi:hypothetical protein